MLPTIRKGENVYLPVLEAEPTLSDLNYRMAYEDNSVFLDTPPLDPGIQTGPRCGNCHRYSGGRCMLAADRPRVDPFGLCDAWARSATDPMMGFRRDGAGPVEYDQQSMPDYGEIYGVDALEDAKDEARSDAERRRIAAAARLFTSYGFHGEAPGPVRVQDQEGAGMTESKRPSIRTRGQKPRLFIRTGPMNKAAPLGGRYYRRVPTGNPKRPWRYYYTREQYENAHKDQAHVNGHEAKQARARANNSAQDQLDRLHEASNRARRDVVSGDRGAKEASLVLTQEYESLRHSLRQHRKGLISSKELAARVSSAEEVLNKWASFKPVQKSFQVAVSSTCLIHGRDPLKLSFHEPHASCTCPR